MWRARAGASPALGRGFRKLRSSPGSPGVTCWDSRQASLANLWNRRPLQDRRHIARPARLRLPERWLASGWRPLLRHDLRSGAGPGRRVGGDQLDRMPPDAKRRCATRVAAAMVWLDTQPHPRAPADGSHTADGGGGSSTLMSPDSGASRGEGRSEFAPDVGAQGSDLSRANRADRLGTHDIGFLSDIGHRRRWNGVRPNQIRAVSALGAKFRTAPPIP